MKPKASDPETNEPAMFRVDFSVHVEYDKGQTSFRREDKLPFVPFIGLDIIDIALGEFELKHVAWAPGCNMFLCQSNLTNKKWTIQEARKTMKKAGWIEDRESRLSDD